MTLVAFDLQPTTVVLFTDTAFGSVDGRVSSFGSKVALFPHADAAFAVSGISTLRESVVRQLERHELFADVDAVVPVVQRTLADTARKLTDQLKPTDSRSFLFGYSPTAARMVGYAFESAAEFEPQQLDDGISVYPPVLDAEGHQQPRVTGWRAEVDANGRAIVDGDGNRRMTQALPTSLAELAAVCVNRAGVNEQRYADGRTAIRIGGDLMLAILGHGLVTVQRCQRLPGYEAMWAEAAANTAGRRSLG